MKKRNIKNIEQEFYNFYKNAIDGQNPESWQNAKEKVQSLMNNQELQGIIQVMNNSLTDLKPALSVIKEKNITTEKLEKLFKVGMFFNGSGLPNASSSEINIFKIRKFANKYKKLNTNDKKIFIKNCCKNNNIKKIAWIWPALGALYLANQSGMLDDRALLGGKSVKERLGEFLGINLSNSPEVRSESNEPRQSGRGDSSEQSERNDSTSESPVVEPESATPDNREVQNMLSDIEPLLGDIDVLYKGLGSLGMGLGALKSYKRFISSYGNLNIDWSDSLQPTKLAQLFETNKLNPEMNGSIGFTTGAGAIFMRNGLIPFAEGLSSEEESLSVVTDLIKNQGFLAATSGALSQEDMEFLSNLPIMARYMSQQGAGSHNVDGLVQLFRTIWSNILSHLGN